MISVIKNTLFGPFCSPGTLIRDGSYVTTDLIFHIRVPLTLRERGSQCSRTIQVVESEI